MFQEQNTNFQDKISTEKYKNSKKKYLRLLAEKKHKLIIYNNIIFLCITHFYIFVSWKHLVWL